MSDSETQGGAETRASLMPTVRTLPTLLITLTLTGLSAAPAAAQDPSSAQTPSLPNSTMRIEGTLQKIEGRYYVIQTVEGKELYLLISKDTELAGTFKIGDRIEVWTSPVEHAIAIRAVIPDQDASAMEKATHTIRGKLIAIVGKYYVMIGADGKEVRLLVNQDTELAGEFRPGDQLEVFTAPVEHAVAIKSAR